MESNETNKPQSDIKQEIFQKIADKSIAMRPRVYFTLRVVALVVLALFILFLSVFILGMISFSIRISGHAFLFGSGVAGIALFLKLFPWLPLVLDIGCIALVVKIMRKFSFGYQRPVLSLLGLGLLFVLGAGLALDLGTSANDRMFEHAERNELPMPLGSMYENARRLPVPQEGLCRCRILSVDTTTITVQDTRPGARAVFTVGLPEKMADTDSVFEPGDIIFIAGNLDTTTITHPQIHSNPHKN
jgi:hypothetical protein